VKSEKNNKTRVIMLFILLVIVIGYSYVNTKHKLSQKDNSSYKKVSIKLENIKMEKGSIQPLKDIEIKNNDEVDFNIDLKNINDYYSFTIDVVNNEAKDIMLSHLYNTSLTKEQEKYIEYSITYNDNTEIKTGDLLKAGKKETYRIMVKYKDNAVLDKNFETKFFLSFSLDFVKADSTATEIKHKPFNVKTGDYINMVPDTTTIPIDTSKTGYTNEQGVINPKELTLWRVIKINSDNTIDIVSENVSTAEVYFEGQTGYLNYVGYLNSLAKNYENNKYTIASRIVGFNNQTKYITNTSMFTIKVPWRYSTTTNDNESLGGGDILHISDINLINEALDTLKCNNLNQEAATYWIASRYYYYRNTNNYYWNYRYIDTNGREDFDNLYYVRNAKFQSRAAKASLRPILTLKSGISGILGNGTKEDPYILD